jgi:hypothetical protein
MTCRASVGNPVVWGKHVFTKKGKNASGDRLRFMRNMRNIVKRVSWFKSSLLLRIINKHTYKY